MRQNLAQETTIDIHPYTSASPAVTSLRLSLPPQHRPHLPSSHSPFSRLSPHELPRLLLVLAVTASFLVFLLAVPFLSNRLPHLGFSTSVSTSDDQGSTSELVTSVTPNGLAYNLGVRPGDRLLSSYTFADATTVTFALDGGTGKTVQLSNRDLETTSPLQRYSFLFLAITFVAVGGPVYVKARQRSAASAFYLFCIASALCLSVASIISLLYPWLLASMFIGLTVWAASFAIFFLKFPLKIGKSPRLHSLALGSIILYALATLAIYSYSFAIDPLVYPLAQLNNSTFIAFCTLLGLASLVRAFFIQRSKLVQNQLSVLVIGTAAAVCPTLLFALLPRLFGQPGLDVSFTALSLGMMPISLAYAITHHQLLGIRGLVKRGVVYVVMGFSVLLTFSFGAVTLGALLPIDWYRGDFGLLAVSIFVFLIAISYGYIHQKVETWVDKFVYHDGYNYKQALLEFSSQLATEQDLDRLTTNLVERTCNLMNLSCGVLLLAEHPEGEETSDITHQTPDISSHEDADNQLPSPNTLRVTPYARFGQGSEWLIEGLQKELADLGIHLAGNEPPELMYFNNRTQPFDTITLSNYPSGPLPPETSDQLKDAAIQDEGTQESETVHSTETLQKPTTRAMRSFLGVPLWTRHRFVGMLCLGNKRTGDSFTKDDLALLGTLSTQASLAIYNAQLFESQRQALLGTIEALAHAIEAKDGYTIQHCERMTERAFALAQLLRLPAREVENIRMGAILHDIGKIGIPDSILNKPGKLTPEEYEIMKEHPVIGARIVQSVGPLTGVVSIVRHHHERWDGSGYPDKLKGTDTPLGARIIAVVDTYGAMTEDRVYRTAPGHAQGRRRAYRPGRKTVRP